MRQVRNAERALSLDPRVEFVRRMRERSWRVRLVARQSNVRELRHAFVRRIVCVVGLHR